MSFLQSFVPMTLTFVKNIIKRCVSLLIVFSIILTECARSAEGEIFLDVPYRSIKGASQPQPTGKKVEVDEGNGQSELSSGRTGKKVVRVGKLPLAALRRAASRHSLSEIPEREMESYTRQEEGSGAGEYLLDRSVERGEFELEEDWQEVLHNPLVLALKDHLASIHGEQMAKGHGIRKIAILAAFAVGVAASGLGSLTFLVGREFPKELAAFAHFDMTDAVANGLGKSLAYSNVGLEALFYMWTISGILPPFQPKQITQPQEEGTKT